MVVQLRKMARRLNTSTGTPSRYKIANWPFWAMLITRRRSQKHILLVYSCYETETIMIYSLLVHGFQEISQLPHCALHITTSLGVHRPLVNWQWKFILLKTQPLSDTHGHSIELWSRYRPYNCVPSVQTQLCLRIHHLHCGKVALLSLREWHHKLLCECVCIFARCCANYWFSSNRLVPPRYFIYIVTICRSSSARCRSLSSVFMKNEFTDFTKEVFGTLESPLSGESSWTCPKRQTVYEQIQINWVEVLGQTMSIQLQI